MSGSERQLKPLKLYYNRHSPYCQKLRFFLEETDLPYEIVQVDLATFDFQSPEFLKLSPAGLIPVIESEYGVVADSTAAMRYLCDRFHLHGFFPVNLEERADVDFWLEYVSQHAGRYLLSLAWHRHWHRKEGETLNHQAVTDSLAGLRKFMPAIDRRLSDRRYLHGPRLTLADINLAAFLFQARFADLSLETWPAVAAFQRGIETRPAWQTVFAAG